MPTTGSPSCACDSSKTHSCQPPRFYIGHYSVVLDLDDFCDVVAANVATWRRAGIRSRLHRSPYDGHPKLAARVTVETHDAEGELIVWDSGEGELMFGQQRGSHDRDGSSSRPCQPGRGCLPLPRLCRKL